MAIPLIITLFLLSALLAPTSSSIASPVKDPELVVQEVHKYDTETFEYIYIVS
jgi:hypothetical protein